MLKNLLKGFIGALVMIIFAYILMWSLKNGYDNIPTVTNTIDAIGCKLANLSVCK